MERRVSSLLIIAVVAVLLVSGCTADDVGIPKHPDEIGDGDAKTGAGNAAEDLEAYGPGQGIHLYGWTAESADHIIASWRVTWGKNDKPYNGSDVEVSVQKEGEIAYSRFLKTDENGEVEIRMTDFETGKKYTFRFLKLDGRDFETDDAESYNYLTLEITPTGRAVELGDPIAQLIDVGESRKLEFSWRVTGPPDMVKDENAKYYFEVEIEDPEGKKQRMDTEPGGNLVVSVTVPFSYKNPGKDYKATVLSVASEYRSYYNYDGEGDVITWTVPEAAVRAVSKGIYMDYDPLDKTEKYRLFWTLDVEGMPFANKKVYMNVRDKNFEGEYYSVEWTRTSDENGTVRAWTTDHMFDATVTIKSVEGDIEYEGDGDALKYAAPSD